jgi:hypothetical protein
MMKAGAYLKEHHEACRVRELQRLSASAEA